MAAAGGTNEAAFAKSLELADCILASLDLLRDCNDRDERASEVAKASKYLNELVDTFSTSNFSEVKKGKKQQMLQQCCAAQNNNKNATFEDVPANVILDSIFPFLSNRQDWVSLTVVNKDISSTLASSKKILPPWPRVCVFSHPYHLRNPIWSPDGSLVASKGTGYQIAIFCQRNGFVKEWEAHSRWNVTSLAFTPNGKFLLSSGYDRHVKIWDCENDFRCVHDWDHLIGGTEDDPNSARLVVFPDSKSFVIHQEGSICIVNICDGAVVQTLILPHGNVGCKEILIAPDRNVVIFEGTELRDADEDFPYCEGKIKVWNIDGGVTHESIDCYDITDKRGVTDLAISSDGAYVASGVDQHVRLYKFTDGRLVLEKELECKERLVFGAVAFTPCGRYLAAVRGYDQVDFDEGYLIVWDLASGKTKRHLCFNASVNFIRYSSKGILLLQIGENIIINASYTHSDELNSDVDVDDKVDEASD